MHKKVKKEVIHVNDKGRDINAEGHEKDPEHYVDNRCKLYWN